MTLKYYLTLSKMLFMIFVLVLIFQFDVSVGNYKYRLTQVQKENRKMREEILVIGGQGLKMTEEERLNINELVEKYQKKRALNQYDWRYKEIGYPVIDPKLAYITCEAGWRKINNEWENVKSIDIKQVNTLKIPASISGFARVSKHKVYGYNVLIEGLVIMANELNKKEIKRVKIRVSHLSKIYINDGQWIKKGDIVGLQGCSGRVAIYDYRKDCYREITEYERNIGMGIHLDFELYIDGYLRNPLASSKRGQSVPL
jgi:murein DD-endopeptidase MepM/ murein hydrolase activator NlpD